MILYNATEELSKILINHFSNLINWSNKRLNLLNIIVTQKMGLFRDRSIHTNQHSEYSRHHTQHGATHKVCYSCYASCSKHMIIFLLSAFGKG